MQTRSIEEGLAKFGRTLDQRIENLYTEPADKMTEEEIFQDSETQIQMFKDQAAVKLVLDDTETDGNYIDVLQWASGWTLSDVLYQSPASASAFDGGNVARANVPKFMVSNHISSIVPKLMGGIFYEDPPFLLRPYPGTTQEVVRAKTAMFSSQLWDMKFEEECERTLDQMALLGTGIMKWGYCHYTKKEKKYQRKTPPETYKTPTGLGEVNTQASNDFEIVYKDKQVSRPWIKYCDIRTVFVDAGCRYGDIRRASHVIYRDYATYQDLDELRDQQGYDIPAEELLKELFMKAAVNTPGADNMSLTLPESMRGYIQHAVPRNYKTTADPMKAPLEILERWDNERVIVVLCCNNHNILIRNEVNPYGKVPFLSANWRNIPDCFYGQGLGQLIGSEQLVEQGVTNLALDLLAYGLQPTAVRKKGFNTPTQTTYWKLGGIIDVDDDVDKAFKFMEMPPIPGAAMQWLTSAQASAATTSGANELVGQGSTLSGARTSGMRSGTGAAAVVSANASRLDGPDGRFIRQIFEPWLYILDELNNDFLPTDVLYKTLGEELGEQFKVDHIDYRSAKLEFQVLAGSHLGAKREMAQQLPLLMQLLNNPTFSQNVNDGGYIFDGIAIFKAFTDAAGWKFSQDFLRPMTPQEKQKHDANSPAAMQARQLQAQQQQQLTQFQQEEQLESQKQLGKAGAEVMRQATERALTPMEVTGEPGNQGFGSDTEI